MSSHQALTGLLLALTAWACAVQVEEPTLNEPKGAAAATSGSGAAGMTSSVAKGGATASAGKGGATSSNGKGGSTGSSSAGTGGQAMAGTGGGDSGGSSVSGSGGSGGTISCAGLPAWTADTNPMPALAPGEAFTYMNQRYEVVSAVTYWNGECPPEATRPTWCDTNYAFTGPTACE
jgi:hypothetical protein